MEKSGIDKEDLRDLKHTQQETETSKKLLDYSMGNIIVLEDGTTWGSIEGCLVRYDEKVYCLESILSFLPALEIVTKNGTLLVSERLKIYVDECTNEAVIERIP